uniref:aldehyde dehydrogenase family protein n=1 Tax=Thioclava sp. UBA3469 TaxID=1947693 RepID=UPI00257AD19D
MLKLNDPSLLETRAYVNGEWIEGAKRFAVQDPATGETVAEVADLDVDATRAAIEAAHAAKPDWAALTGKERAGYLRRFHDLMMENQDDLAAILTAEMGKPLSEAKG